MKSERRHELQHNALADTVTKLVAELKPYATAIGGAVLLGCVIFAAYSYFSKAGSEKIASGWDEYYAALNNRNHDTLTAIAEKYGNTPVARWARVVAADIELDNGCARILQEKITGRDLVQTAANNYSSVLADTDDDILKQRAFFGLGRAHEALGSLENLNKAREDYQTLVDKWPDGVYTNVAKSRLADLERPRTKEFYDWFVKHEPPRTGDSILKKPDFFKDSPDQFDIKPGSILDDFKLEDSLKSTPDKPASDQPDQPEEPLLPELPPAGSPSEEKPAETPPAAETPANAPADKPATP